MVRGRDGVRRRSLEAATYFPSCFSRFPHSLQTKIDSILPVDRTGLQVYHHYCTGKRSFYNLLFPVNLASSVRLLILQRKK